MLLPVAEELNLPIAMKLGAHREVNASLRTGGVSRRSRHTYTHSLTRSVEGAGGARSGGFSAVGGPRCVSLSTEALAWHANPERDLRVRTLRGLTDEARLPFRDFAWLGVQDGVVAADVGDLRRLCSANPKYVHRFLYTCPYPPDWLPTHLRVESPVLGVTINETGRLMCSFTLCGASA